jgi:hypothetical protein
MKTIQSIIIFVTITCLSVFLQPSFVRNLNNPKNNLYNFNSGNNEAIFASRQQKSSKPTALDVAPVQSGEQYSGGVARAIYGNMPRNVRPVESITDISRLDVVPKKSVDQQSLDLANNKKQEKSIIVSAEQLRSYMQIMSPRDLAPFIDMLVQQPAGKEPIILWNADMSKSLQIFPDAFEQALRLVQDAPVARKNQSGQKLFLEYNKVAEKRTEPVAIDKSVSKIAVQIEQAPTLVAKIGYVTSIKNRFLRMLGFKIQDVSDSQNKALDTITQDSAKQIENVEKSDQSSAIKQRRYSDIIMNMLQRIKDLFILKPVDLQAEQ